MVNSVYIHIPFCKSKCKYCSFTSFTNSEKIMGYLFSLLKEIDVNYNGEALKTLYFGGGTPSLLSIDFVKKVISKFKLLPECEITFEFNPDDCNLEYLQKLKELGINRLSIGSQTFNDNLLNFIGRRHSSKDIIKTIKTAQEAGFSNRSVDLIYGLPNQTIEILKEDLRIITDLDIQHVSTYGLKIEENSFFYLNPPKNLPDDDLQADMYLEINNTLENLGFKRYEISNFAKLGYESKHNLNYWNNAEYYGFGVAAHGYVEGVRYSNFTTLEEYMNSPATHECGHFVTEQEKLEEEIFLGFRKAEGINIEKINNAFNINFNEKYDAIINKYSPEYVVKTDNGWTLTTEGVLLSNNILSDFIE